MRFVRAAIGALVGAVLGAAAGRLVARWRADSEAGLAPQLDFEAAQPHPKDLVPGLVAALRAQDPPWSYLHIPPWLAAFAVNFGVAALARELGPFLRALGLGGVAEDITEAEAPWAQPPWDGPPADASRSEVWTSESGSDPAPAEQTPGFRPFAG